MARIISVPKTSIHKPKRRSTVEELDALATGEKTGSEKQSKKTKPAALADSQTTGMTDDAWINRPQTENVEAAEAIESVRRYVNAVKALENGSNPKSVEFVYRMGMRAAADLMFVEKHVIDEQTFNGIKLKMKKLFVFNREELFKVYANNKAFFDLAQENGNLPKDTSYFRRAMEFTRESRPAYSKRTTEFYDCVNYGSGLLSKAYQAWTSYQSHFPNSYSSFVRDEISEASKAFEENKCACGNEDDIRKEFKKFAEMFPNSPLNAVLTRRLSQRNPADQDEFRLHCKGF